MSAAAMPVARGPGGHLLPGARLNPSGRAAHPITALQRRFWTRLEALVEENGSIEDLCEQVILALTDKDFDPHLRREVLPRILGPVVHQIEFGRTDGELAPERSPEETDRLAAEFGSEITDSSAVHQETAIDVTPTRVDG